MIGFIEKWENMSEIVLLIIDMQVGNFSKPNPIYEGNELLKKLKV
jgi:hypothetical protein